MSKKLLFNGVKILILFLNQYLLSQNLIPNNSFENYSDCPSLTTDYDLIVHNFYSPTSQGTPEYFNSCNNANDGLLGVPSNILGSQNAQEGDAYSGIYTYANQGSLTIDGREYLQAPLVSVLNPCSIYSASFYVSLVDSAHYAINSIGAFFSDSAIHRNDYYCFSYHEPQVKNPASRMLSDKTAWTKIEGMFVAQGNEQYITIGNFDLDSEIDTFPTNMNYGLNRAYAYYYVDDVSLTLFADASVLANAGPDLALEIGDSIFIGQEISNLNCTWSILGGAEIADSISGIWVNPTQTTSYVVEQNLCGTITYDTVTVFVHGVGLQESSPLTPSKGGVVIYPNPNTGRFLLQSSNIESIQISDLQGRLVKFSKTKVDETLFEIELNTESGLYNIQIINNGKTHNIKVKVIR